MKRFLHKPSVTAGAALVLTIALKMTANTAEAVDIQTNAGGLRAGVWGDLWARQVRNTKTGSCVDEW